MKKILVVYATAGIGHKKASLAVKKALDEVISKDAVNVEVTLIDSLDYTSEFFKWSYLQIYLLAVNKFSSLWGFSYYLTDNFYVNLLISRLRRINNWINTKKFREYLINTKPDVIISTHFLGSEVIADMKKKGILTSRLITVVTDYRLHSWWVQKDTDVYIVSNEDAKDDLVRWGIKAEKVRVMGIPIEPVFLKKVDEDKVWAESGLARGIFTVLIIGGGFGVGPIQEIVQAMNEVSKPIQALVICGHNKKLVEDMEALKKNLKIKLKVMGFVDNVYEYMEIADVLISKSGGITVTESLAKELPMIVIAPIPGQETRNSDFLVRHGAALRIEKPEELKSLLEYLISNPDKMNSLKESINKVKTPNASYNIARLAIELTHS